MSVTDTGKALIARGRAAVDAEVAELALALPPARRDSLARSLRTLLDAYADRHAIER